MNGSRHMATESRNLRTTGLDRGSSADTVRLVLNEDLLAVHAALAAADPLAEAVDRAVTQLEAGGCVHYFGAGASGRLAMLDASEVTPTFGAPHGMFQFHFPGGDAALLDSSVDCEDDDGMGGRDAEAITAVDVAVGITASGTTPYVAGALRRAREQGATTVLVTMSDASPLTELADVVVSAVTGPEALAGSTRLKAGTATKVLLNAFSTAVMVRQGRTYSNLMVGVRATNEKLRARSVSILVEASEAGPDECRRALDDAAGDVRIAMVCLLAGCDLATASTAIERHPHVRDAVAFLRGSAT